MNNEIGILLTSHPGHRIFMKECLQYWGEAAKEFPLILGWDDVSFKYHHPLPAHVELLITGVKLGLQEGERWQLRTGLKLLQDKGCKYILKAAADLIVKDWKSIPSIIPVLDEIPDASIITTRTSPANVTVGTHIFFGKIDDLIKALDTPESMYVGDWIEKNLHRGMDICGMKKIIHHVEWWQEKVWYLDPQMKWIEKTGNYYGAAWSEGAKEYDVTELEVFGKIVPRNDIVIY